MGYFALPPNSIEKTTAEEYVATAIQNLKLWQGSQGSDYLLGFAATFIQKAIEKKDQE